MKKETIQPESRDLAFRDLILKTPIGEKIPTCMQCGICAGSCPVSHEMDYTPRQLVRMVQLGLKKDVLNSNTIWICTTCFSCSVRCPRGIRPTELMEMLKPIAVAEGIRNKNAKFDQVFSDVVKKNGRASEFLLISKYSLSDPGMIKQAPFGLALISKGKLPLVIDKMDDTRELEGIFDPGTPPGENKEKPEKQKSNEGPEK
ncbi:MAG: 4Fe-4S dicluster domain-containing protein [Candidatus Methanoperedens sp.]|nr:4Fe-4S dicluster domain-containing protein [Candidatus Methanoperedens sp.]MCZ7370489.1 4Fe-4S dicluster domain-containing protein [Candidatus Methanoperedens sp.]